MRKEGITLIEILVVVIIAIILATLATPLYRKTVERAKEREAEAMLRLIKEAEKIYRLEYNTYISCSSTADCNSILNLDLPSQNWNYSVPSATSTEFCAQADSTEGLPSWRIRYDEDNPVKGSCP
ncbi:MAG: hypothetical protein J7K17_05180 [Candidatus Omnitrophica bacterium]|nr:hypothetical protein [Candidatus Omnitrophota bacterium]